MWKRVASAVAVLAFGTAGYQLWQAHRMQVGVDECLMGARIDVSQAGRTVSSFKLESSARYEDVLHHRILLHFEPPVWGHLDLGGSVTVRNQDGLLVREEPFSDPFAGDEGNRVPFESVALAQFPPLPKGEYEVGIILERADASLAGHSVSIRADHSFTGYYTFHIFGARLAAAIFGAMGLLSMIPILVSLARKPDMGKAGATS